MRKLLAVLLLALAAQCQASRLFNGSSDVITVPGVGTPVDISTGPMVISVWIYPTTGDLTGEHVIAAKWDGSDDLKSQYWMGIGGLGTDKQVGFVIGAFGALTGVYGQCGLDLVANQWYQVTLLVDPVGTFFGSPAVGMWIASTVGSCNTSTAFRERRTAGGVNLLLGNETGNSFFFGGRMAEFAMWNTVITNAERIALAEVCPAKIHRTGIVSYKPLWGASGASIEPDLSRYITLNGTLTGTTIANHAPCAP